MEPATSATALAAHYLDINQADRALAALDKAGFDPDDAYSWELRAQALVDLGRFTSAARAAEAGLALEADSIALLDLLSIAHAGLGDLERAEVASLEALRLAPDHPVLLCRYALLLARGGELTKAGKVLAEAERVAPDDEAVIRTRITLAYLRGDDKAAERESRRALAELDPEDPLGHTMLGLRAATQGNPWRASRHWDTAARADLSDETAVKLAREGRIGTHPLLWPVIPIDRFGVGKLWIGAVAVLLLLRATGQEVLTIVASITWVAFCVYSWTVPPLVRRYYERKVR
jgi:tetratricopeptide (TPR) repeat protein